MLASKHWLIRNRPRRVTLFGRGFLAFETGCSHGKTATCRRSREKYPERCRTCPACSARPIVVLNRAISNRTERLCAGILQHRPEDFDALHLLGLLNFQRPPHGRGAPLSLGSAQGQFELGGCDVESRGWRCMRRDATTRRSQATAARCGWRRIIRKFSIISANTCLEAGHIKEALFEL